jgi:hypothetical protein
MGQGISTLLDEIADRGWFLNNLFQRNDGSWRCNLRDYTVATGWGQGHSSTVAIEAAMASSERYELVANVAPEGLGSPFDPPSLLSLLPQRKVYRR